MNSAKIFQMIRLHVPKKLFEKTVVIFKGKNLKNPHVSTVQFSVCIVFKGPVFIDKFKRLKCNKR